MSQTGCRCHPFILALILVFAAAGGPAQEGNPFGEKPQATPMQNPFEVPAQAAATTAPAAAAAPFEPATPAKSGPFEDIVPTQTAAPFLPETPAAPISPQKDIKGLYVLTTAKGFQTPEQISALITDFEAGSFNRLYVEVRTTFGVAYDSDIEQSLSFITPGFSNPFQQIRERAPKDAALIAVVTLLPAYNAGVGAKPPDTNPVGRNPAFANRSIDGRTAARDNSVYMDPGNPEVGAYLANLIREMDSKLHPDGYLFRGVRYPGPDWGYSNRAVVAFRGAVGGKGDPPEDDPLWCAWRRHQLNNLLKSLRDALPPGRENVTFAVEMDAVGTPPKSWDEWLVSDLYAGQMQDWIGWCREGLVDEIVFDIHERMAPQGNILPDWVTFLGRNTSPARPIISLAGAMNFQLGFTNQYGMVRSRGIGTILHHYAEPLRSSSRGFYASLPNIVFHSEPGNPIPGPAITGPVEARVFAMGQNPPKEVLISTPTPIAYVNPLDEKPLVFLSPTAVPTGTPAPKYVPEHIMRKLTLESGSIMEAYVLEVTPENYTVQAENSTPMVISRSVIVSIEPPL